MGIAPVSPTQVRPLERAQQVCERSHELASEPAPDDLEAITFDLLRTAHYDRATLEHALVLNRTRLRQDPADFEVRAGAQLLSEVTDFLGLTPCSRTPIVHR